MGVLTIPDTKSVNSITKEKMKNLPFRRPVVFDFKPDTDQKLINEAVDKAISKYLNRK